MKIVDVLNNGMAIFTCFITIRSQLELYYKSWIVDFIVIFIEEFKVV